MWPSSRHVLTALDLSPFLKVPGNNLLDIIGDMDATNVKCPVHPHKTSNTAHVVSVVTELVASEAINIAREYVSESALFLHPCVWQPMEKLALLPLGT